MNTIIHNKPCRIEIAPMMDWTDRHFRYLARLISSNVWLYSEMIVTGAILYGHRDRFLKYNAKEHPIAVQLGGSNPRELAECAKICEAYGYDEINLNVGCPSDRVQAGTFGACLMLEPERVAECVAEMRANVKIPITVKTRLGVDEHDDYAFVHRFINLVASAGCHSFIMHARKAWLRGLSPKENRTIPSLDYERVYQLKKDFPRLHFSINGGIQNVTDIQHHLQQVDGVMIGREIYKNTYILAEIEQHIFHNPHPALTREEILERYKEYIKAQITIGVPAKCMTKHLMGLFHGQPYAREKRKNEISNEIF